MKAGVRFTTYDQFKSALKDEEVSVACGMVEYGGRVGLPTSHWYDAEVTPANPNCRNMYTSPHFC